MNRQDDLDRTLAAWFEADAAPPPPARGLDLVLDATRHRRPRAAWLAAIGSQWVGEGAAALPGHGARWRTGRTMRLSWALLLLVATLAMFLGGAILVGARLLTPTPAGLGELVYALDGDIFVADWDGSHPVRIADGTPAWGEPDCHYGSPVWSPDGRHLAYRCHAAENGLIIADPDGRVVGSIPGVGWVTAWSPDSTRVATWVEFGTHVGIYRLDGTREAVLALPAGLDLGRDDDPHWAPDGGSVLVSLSPLAGEARQTWELRLDGSPPQPLSADDPRSHWEATWSADGALVAYVGGDTQETSRSLIIAESGDMGAREVVAPDPRPSSSPPCEPCPDGIHDPLMSPGGDLVAFSVHDGDGTDDLRVVDVATGAVTRLGDARAADRFDSMAFSSAGDRLLFSGPDPVGGLWTVRTDGSDARLLVPGTIEGDWRP